MTKLFAPLKKLYHWILAYADKPQNTLILSLVAFTESIFFLIPPEVLLIPMSAARPKKAPSFALLAGLTSCAGAVGGYLLGYFFWDSIQDWFIGNIFSQQSFDIVADKYQAHAFVTVFVAAFTPIPFKVFTIAAGVFQIAFTPFIIGALVGRCTRYLILGLLFFFLGEKIKIWIEKYFELLTVAATAILILSYFLLR